MHYGLKTLKNLNHCHHGNLRTMKRKSVKHKQIRNALYNFNEKQMSAELNDLFNLRHKADYEPFLDISAKEVEDSISHMEKIFGHLKFE